MVRQKNTGQKHRYGSVEYIPVIKKRKRKSPRTIPEKSYKILLPTNASKKYYLGEIFLGTTNNVFPKEYESVRMKFKSPERCEWKNKEQTLQMDAIVIECDTVSVIVTNCDSYKFVKDLILYKAFAFDFAQMGDNVYLNVYFSVLPISKLYPKLTSVIQNLFSLFFSEEFDSEVENINSRKLVHDGSEISSLYHKLSEKRKNHTYSITEQEIQHRLLRPTLRPYQKKSVQWMLERENSQNYKSDDIHPLYKLLRLKSGENIFYNKYTGNVTLEKPVVPETSKGGILADEMGLGKTVEVLACILLHAKVEEFDEIIPSGKRKKNTIYDSDDDSPLVETPKKINIVSGSDNSLFQLDELKKRTGKTKENSQNFDQAKKLKVPNNWVKSKKSATKLALETWYESIMSTMSVVETSIYKDPNLLKVQCICGSTSEEDIVKCTNCHKYQHTTCFGYKNCATKYLCPQCWMNEPLLETRATLIVTPTTLKTQWSKEITRHIKGHRKVLQYDGTPVYPDELSDYDIVLTNYSTLRSELWQTEIGETCSLRTAKRYSNPGSPLTRLRWWRLCLDEAQTVESPSHVSEMAKKINAVHRWAITGTPISKNISDVFGLLDYLQITPYNDLTTWNNILYDPYLNGDEEPLVAFLSNVLWRTAKKDVNDQINIPKQTCIEHLLEFSAIEKYFYKREHDLICSDFLSNVRKFDLSLLLDSLNKATVKKILAPLLTLRHACTHPNTIRGKYLATKKQVSSMKDLLNALIAKNITDSEDCLRVAISSLNGIAGIHILLNEPQQAITHYRKVLQLFTRFTEENSGNTLNIDKPLIIHTLYNLAEVLELNPPDQPTLRDATLRKDCEDLEKIYMGKFISESTSAFKNFIIIMSTVEKLQNSLILKDGQWYSDGLDWVMIHGFFEEFKTKIQTNCDNASVQNTVCDATERTVLQLLYCWDKDLSDLRANLFESVEALYNVEEPGDTCKIVVKKHLINKAMNCHLRPQKKGKQAKKCPVCVANDDLKNYELKLYAMSKRKNTFEDMSLQGSWKPSVQELIFKALLAVLKAKKCDSKIIKDGELHSTIIENLKKEFKELRYLWTHLDQQICARDELDICKVRLQLKTNEEETKVNKVLKNLSYIMKTKTDTINLLGIHELDYQNSLLEVEAQQNLEELDKLLGTHSYLETLKKQQYEGQSPDPCPICKNTLTDHWSILLCGHCYCLECIQLLLEQSLGNHIQCSICRNKQKHQDLSYIKAGQLTTNQDIQTIKGNYSTKVEAVIKLLLDLKDKDPNVKVLLFSTWVTVLKHLKSALDKNSISSEMALHGNLDKKITNFKDSSKNVTVFLLPIQLGSKGLNLIEATHVILVEPLLNPADELQAIGRVNRIGQTKTTFVHKFVIKQTIEESIHHATTTNAENWDKTRVTLQHLVDLFNNTNFDEILNLDEPDLEGTPSGSSEIAEKESRLNDAQVSFMDNSSAMIESNSTVILNSDEPELEGPSPESSETAGNESRLNDAQTSLMDNSVLIESNSSAIIEGNSNENISTLTVVDTDSTN